MKTIMINFTSRKDKELFFKVVLLSTLAMGTFTSLKRLGGKNQHVKITNIYSDNYGDFDRAHIPNKPLVIAKMISVLRPGFGYAQREHVATQIHKAIVKYKIAPQIVVAIIDTESNFRQELVSSTGDLSMAQINPEVWNKEFLRMNLEPIDVEKLKTDEAYSLIVMTQILHILKTRYEKTDRRWYARYHSKTKKHKRVYLAKLEARLKLLEKSNLINKKEVVRPLLALQ